MNDLNKAGATTEDYDTVFGDFNQLNSELHNIDERGLILSLAAFAEDALGKLLRSFMLPNDATKQLLDGFNAPLGTFSSRIKAAYALGLITEDQFHDLERLRKIRNDFSHTWRPISFADRSILAHIKAINYSSIDDKFPETPLEKVRSALSSLLVELKVLTNQLEKKGKRVQLTGSRLTAGYSGDLNQQLSQAKSQVLSIENELLTAVGEKKTFFILQLGRVVQKLYIAEANAPADRSAEVTLLALWLIKKIYENKEYVALLGLEKPGSGSAL